MAVGKTTLGRKVAELLEMPFVDLDETIASHRQKSVPEIFSSEGEQAFRRLESQALRLLVSPPSPPAVVATGGGAFTVARNRTLMIEAGTTVWLDAPFDAIRRRADSDQRPLWVEPERARELAESRKKYYGLATYHLKLENDSEEESTERLYRLLAAHRNA